MVTTSSLPQSLHRLKSLNFSKPVHYKICFEPNVPENHVKTTQTITFEVIREPNSDLTSYINSYSKTVIKNATLNGERIILEPATDASGTDYEGNVLKYTIPSSQVANTSKIGSTYTLDIESHSHICDDLQGIYLSKFKSKDLIEHSLLTTKFEPYFARRAFLCVDEPTEKAKFDVSFIVDEDKEVICNTPLKEQKKIEETGKVCHTFETTPILSTYLIGFGVGNFVKETSIVKNTDGSDILVEVVAPVGTRDNLALPLKFAVEHLKTLMKYFGKFPIPNISHLAVPDFKSGAMENNGIITYRDSILLVDEETPIANRLFASAAITHELAHHWFGNLVTMEWWDDLWLNESFATAVQYEISQKTHERLGDDKIYPTNLDFSSNRKLGAMNLDAKKSTHPIHCSINSPQAIESIFDEISYGKGATLLKMLINYLTPDVFFTGIRAYLKKYEYSNARGENLWQVLNETAGQDISGMMKTWITMSGFPTVSYRYSNDKSQIIIEQSQYMFVVESENDKIWHIPINFEYTTESGKKNAVKFILDKKSTAVDVPKDDEITLVKFDVGSNTLSVSNLDKTLHQAAIANFLKLSDIEKFSFFSNLKYLISSIKIVDGKPEQFYENVTIPEILSVVQTINVSKNDHAARLGLIALLRKLKTIYKLVDIDNPGTFEKFKSIAFNVIREFPEPSLNFNSFDEYLPYMTNQDMVKLLFSLEDDKFISQLSERYAHHQKSGIKLDESNLVHVYRAHVIQNLNSKPLDEAKSMLVELLDKVNEDIFSRTRMKKFAGICISLRSELVNTLMDFAFSDKVRLQDANVFIQCVSQPAASSAYAKYISRHPEKVAKFSHRHRIQIIKGMRSCSTQSDIDALEILRNYKPTKITEDRIFDETRDFIHTKKLTVEVFKSQICSFEI